MRTEVVERRQEVSTSRHVIARLVAPHNYVWTRLPSGQGRAETADAWADGSLAARGSRPRRAGRRGTPLNPAEIPGAWAWVRRRV